MQVKTRSCSVSYSSLHASCMTRVVQQCQDLDHGCARVAHCVTARWRNFSHYCCPLRQYDVWFTCSEHREALIDEPTAHDVHKQEFTVKGGSTQFATEQVGRLRCVTAVDGGLEAFPFSILRYRDLRTRALDVRERAQKSKLYVVKVIMVIVYLEF